MSDAVELAKAAREQLAAALNALQASEMPNELVEIAEPIAQGMGVLHRIERSGGANLDGLDDVLAGLRKALDRVQNITTDHPAIEVVMERVAMSLVKVSALVRARGKAQPAPQPAPPPQAAPPLQAAWQPPAPQQAPPPQAPVQQAPPQAASPPQAARPQPAPQQAHPPQSPSKHASQQPRHAQPQPAQRPAPVPAQPVQQPARAAPAQPAPAQPPPQQGYAQPPAPAQAYGPPPQPAPKQPSGRPTHPEPGSRKQPLGQPAQQPPPPSAPAARAPHASGAQRAKGTPGRQPLPGNPNASTQPAAPRALTVAGTIDVELGTHSSSNFYKGLGGNDVIEHGGVFVATYKVPKIGAVVNLRVLLPGNYEFQANAVVQWTREARGGETTSDPGFGARFTQISPEGRQLVYRYTRNREPMFYDDL